MDEHPRRSRILVIRFKGGSERATIRLGHLRDDGTETHFEELFPETPGPIGYGTRLIRRGTEIGSDRRQSLMSIVSDRLEEGIRVFIIDLTELKWVNDGYLGIAAGCHARTHLAGARTICVGLCEGVKRLFQTTRMDEILTIDDDVRQALAHLASSKEEGA